MMSPHERRPRRGSVDLSIALVLAAGSGERLGAEVPKCFASLGERPMLELSLDAIGSSTVLSGVVLVVPPDRLSLARDIAARAGPAIRIEAVVPGGRTRQQSVRLGLDAVPAAADVVVCHDAARPFASPGLFDRVVLALGPGREADGAVPVVRSPDTVKRIRAGMVVETIPREDVGLVQTPQAFTAGALRDAHARAAAADLQGTDDAMLLEMAGYRVVAVEGEPANFKITTAHDMRRAEALLRELGAGARPTSGP